MFGNITKLSTSLVKLIIFFIKKKGYSLMVEQQSSKLFVEVRFLLLLFKWYSLKNLRIFLKK
jgi:hypothetical protein